MINPALRQTFSLLAQQWHENTDYLSSPKSVFKDPNYQAIIQIGSDVVPLILEEMRDRGGRWFKALEEITGETIIKKSSSGITQDIKRDCLEWGERRGLLPKPEPV